MFRLRVDKGADISLENTRTFRYRLAAIVHDRHFRQHGADTAVSGAPTFNDIKHPASASIGQIISPRYIAKLVNCPRVMVPRTTIQLPPPTASRFAIPIAI